MFGTLPRTAFWKHSSCLCGFSRPFHSFQQQHRSEYNQLLDRVLRPNQLQITRHSSNMDTSLVQLSPASNPLDETTYRSAAGQQDKIEQEYKMSSTPIQPPQSPAIDEAAIATQMLSQGWISLNTCPLELTLDHCLPTGQSFRWQQQAQGVYIGVIGQRLVYMAQVQGDVLYQVVARGHGAEQEDDDAVIREYFNLPCQAAEGVSLAALSATWAKACNRYARIAPYLPGARMLRQNPVECLFQFICSSNNHISRIHGMVGRLCSSYGTHLKPTAPLPDISQLIQLRTQPSLANVQSGVSEDSNHALEAPTMPAKKRQRTASPTRSRSKDSIVATSPATPIKQELLEQADDVQTPLMQHAPMKQAAQQESLDSSPAEETTAAAALLHYAFPTLDQLSLATEEELRAAGFGYRAKFIVQSVQQLREHPEGGEAWLMGLRQAPFQETVEALTTLAGVGPKVAACVALFSLDKHDAIPVDTHVWQIAVKYYIPSLKGKSLTKKITADVQQAFVSRFGAYAGWAHNALFISELPAHRNNIP